MFENVASTSPRIREGGSGQDVFEIRKTVFQVFMLPTTERARSRFYFFLCALAYTFFDFEKKWVKSLYF
jgi:hypothetical protein